MSDIDEILSEVPQSAGAFAPAAEALETPITEETFGSPALNADHVLGHTGLRNLLSGDLSKKILKAADKSPDTAALSGLGQVESVISKHAGEITDHLDGIFSEKERKADEPEPLESDEHREAIEQINHLANDPNALISRLNEATAPLHAVAPQIASNVQQTATRAIQFLASKVAEPDPSPLGEDHDPSATEIAQFHQYLNVIESPKRALQQIKDGTLTPETVETLQTVYPTLYDHMKREMIARLTPELPYQTKMALSEFLQEPLESSLLPERVASLQESYTGSQNPPPPPPGKTGKVSSKQVSKISVASRTSLKPSDD